MREEAREKRGQRGEGREEKERESPELSERGPQKEKKPARFGFHAKEKVPTPLFNG